MDGLKYVRQTIQRNRQCTRQEDSSRSERDGLQDVMESCYDVKNRGWAGGGRVENAKIIIVSNHNGQD